MTAVITITTKITPKIRNFTNNFTQVSRFFSIITVVIESELGIRSENLVFPEIWQLVESRFV
jgi:hypothetical protein